MSAEKKEVYLLSIKKNKMISLERMIEIGYGFTNKPIPPARMKKLKKMLEELQKQT